MWSVRKSQRVSLADAEALANVLRGDTSGRFRNIWIHDDDDGFSQVIYESFFFRVWQLKCTVKGYPMYGYQPWTYLFIDPEDIQHFG